MAVTFSYKNISGLPWPVNFVSQAGKYLHKIENLTGGRWGEVSLVLVKPARMRQLNARYRRRDKVTDVLSFIYQASAPVDGEIVICRQQAGRQAKDSGISLVLELEFLFVHGALHLLGYDHIKPKDRKKMTATEIRVLGRGRMG